MPEACNFIEKETLAQVFSCEFYEISKNMFSAEHVWATVSQTGLSFDQFHNQFKWRSQNLKEVPQNFAKVFNIDDVRANDVIQRNQHHKEKE